MKRLIIVALAFACACSAREYEPSEVEKSLHRKEVYALAFNYVVETFNLQVTESSSFNPVRFNSHGVWGNFEARIKELGGDRFEVQGWLSAVGHEKNRIPWTIHIRYGMVDPLGWRYRKVDEVVANDPEFLGWKFAEYRSLGYRAEYDEQFLAQTFK